MAGQGYMQRRNSLRDIWARLAAGNVTVAAAGVNVPAASFGASSDARTGLSKMREIYATPYDYASVTGDYAGDWGPAIKKMIAENDHSFIPPGTWGFYQGQVLQVKGKRVFGVRGKSKLVRVGSVDYSTYFDRGAFFIFGNCHPNGFLSLRTAANRFARYAITGSVAAGDRAVTLTSGTDAAALSVGQTVWIRDATVIATYAPEGEFYRTSAGAATTTGDGTTGYGQPDFAQLNRIQGIASTVVTFERPIHSALSTAIISPIGGIDGYMTTALGVTVNYGLCEDTEFEGLSFYGGSEAFSRMGAYRCTLRNIEHWGAVHGPELNAFVEGKIEGWRGTYSLRGMEVKMACSQTVVRDVDLSYRPVTGYENTTSPVVPFEIGERSFKMTIDNLRISTSAEWAATQRTFDFKDCWECKLVNSSFDLAGGLAGQPIGFAAHSDSGSVQSTRAITVAGNSINMRNARASLVRSTGTSVSAVENVAFTGNTWRGSNPTGQLFWLEQYSKGFTENDQIFRRLVAHLCQSGSTPITNGAPLMHCGASGGVSAPVAVYIAGSTLNIVAQATDGTKRFAGISVLNESGIVSVAPPGTRNVSITSGAAFAIGVALTSDANGKLITAVSGDWVVAVSEQLASAGSQTVLVRVVESYKLP